MKRRPLAALVPLTLCAVLLVGCGDDPEPEVGPGDDATTPAAGPASEDPTETSSPEPEDEQSSPSDSGTVDPEEGSEDPSDDTDTPSTPVPADAEDLCAAFADAYDALLEAGPELSGDQDEKVPVDLVEAFQQWGQDLADADLPSDFTADQRAGVGIMSRVLLAVPDDATGKDLDAIDTDLSAREDDKVESVTDYVDETCDLDF